jgi:SAM-dependent methyltransferase
MNPATQRMEREPITANAQDLVLRCPHCGSQVGNTARVGFSEAQALICSYCFAALRCREGVWDALPEGRGEHYADFIANYERIRALEGRGSRNPEFYLALPYRDVTGRNQDQWTIRGRSYQCLEERIVANLEKTFGTPLDVLDIGAGNCWLSYRLALRGHRPVAVDLLENPLDGLGAASHYASRVPKLFPRFRAESENLPFAGQQFDLAIFNASFHYAEDYTRTLGEALRCLRRPGCVVICDTPWYRREESGEAMLRERRASFQAQFGLASDALRSREFLTDDRLHNLASTFQLQWQVIEPSHGWRWRMRPLMAKLRRRREPSKFRIYLAEVTQ